VQGSEAHLGEEGANHTVQHAASKGSVEGAVAQDGAQSAYKEAHPLCPQDLLIMPKDDPT